jgi:hypothetical protein
MKLIYLEKHTYVQLAKGLTTTESPKRMKSYVILSSGRVYLTTLLHAYPSILAYLSQVSYNFKVLKLIFFIDFSFPHASCCLLINSF